MEAENINERVVYLRNLIETVFGERVVNIREDRVATESYNGKKLVVREYTVMLVDGRELRAGMSAADGKPYMIDILGERVPYKEIVDRMEDFLRKSGERVLLKVVERNPKLYGKIVEKDAVEGAIETENAIYTVSATKDLGVFIRIAYFPYVS